MQLKVDDLLERTGRVLRCAAETETLAAKDEADVKCRIEFVTMSCPIAGVLGYV